MHRLFLFKAFQLCFVTYPHTVVLETLIDNEKLKFFYLSVLWNYLAYTYSFFDNISHTVCEKTAIHSLVCVLRSLGLHFHEGVEKIKESVKNTETENLQNEQVAGKTSCTCTVRAKIKEMYNFFKF